MTDEREHIRADINRPRPTREALAGLKPVERPHRSDEVAESYRRTDQPARPPERTDAQHVLVRQIMSHPAHTLPPGATLHDASELMRRYEVRHVPIVADGEGEDGILVGLLSETDITRCVQAGDTDWRERTLDRFMTPKPPSIAPTATLHDAAKLLISSHLSGLPVLASPGRVVGFLSSRDVLKVLVRRAPLALWI